MASRELSAEELFRRITGHEPYDYQLRAWEKIDTAMSNGGKVVIEVPTAGGKTEAAIVPFLVEAYNGTWAVSRLIYALPTRSLVEKQAERIRKLLVKVLELKGKSEREAKELAERLVIVEYGLEPTHAFLGWVVVTTWDAFLYGLAAHRTVGRRFTFPAGAIAQSLVVFDEVQMYQDESLYMPRLLSLVVKQLSKANVPVVVMSATIPSELRKMISGEPEIVMVRSDDGKKPERGKVSVQVVEGTIESVLDDIKKALKRKERVLIVRNTVDRAVSTYLTLKPVAEELGVEALLIHGRFAVEDRKKKERALDGAQLIVATQVVEAGLDLLNVGLVVTDIAPLDALIQRIGRCARRKGEKGKAIVLVETQDIGSFPKIKSFSEARRIIEERIGAKIEPFVEFENHKEYKRVLKLTLVSDKKQTTWYIGTLETIKELKKKKPPKDLFIVPYDTAPYDPLVLLRTYDELDSLGHYLYNVEEARKALDRVYEFHYANNIVPKEFHSAYIYFRELKLFSAPPEYELRSRPELYSMLYILDEDLEKELKPNSRNEVNLNPNRIIRISHSTLGAMWDSIKNCIKRKVVREWDSKKEKYRWVLESVNEKSPRALTIYAVSKDCYSEELGLWRRTSDATVNGRKEVNQTQVTRTSKTHEKKNFEKKGQATLLDFVGGE
ncbi:CRISPR-associated helicase Cas3' [Thermococcus gammatolerans]|uniref:CRISPR-associated helicase Cas3, core n=1 Tax=Thermococcus gammatolerans (strain DSM 15229 / JCM 11827 / EJ3) TaxID=593117 RepID=C5A6D4_THEGJ|nr:CRISPR-associated helicase Cas3' [Thermococcus gammatolerans]ACS33796.1 CRISPR-associated helicase Cas3, core [Thermococcus gammatolerans EJ3]